MNDMIWHCIFVKILIIRLLYEEYLQGAFMEKKDTPKHTNYKQMQRLAIIHEMIKSDKYPSREELIRTVVARLRCDVLSPRTIQRDLDVLRYSFHAPMEYNRSKDGYYYTEPGFEIGFQDSITEKQAFYLSICKRLMEGLKGTPVVAKINDVINFLSGYSVGDNSFASRIGTLPKPYTASIPQENWDAVMNALKFNRIIEFDYTGRYKKEKTHRRIWPYQFMLNDGTPMLFAYDELAASGKGGERLFVLNRMENIKDTGKTFKLPENYDFASRCRGGRFGMFISDYCEEYEIELYHDARYLVRECVWADDQVLIENDEKDCTTIKFTSAQYLKVLEWVLARGDCAIPRKPERLVNLWKYSITNMKWNMEHNL